MGDAPGRRGGFWDIEMLIWTGREACLTRLGVVFADDESCINDTTHTHTLFERRSLHSSARCAPGIAKIAGSWARRHAVASCSGRRASVDLESVRVSLAHLPVWYLQS